MSEPKHTPTPWQLSGNGLGVYGPPPDEWGITSLYAYAAGGGGIPDEEQRANAALIVRACNSHEALTAACEEALQVLAVAVEAGCRDEQGRPDDALALSAAAGHATLARLRAALALAKGDPPA